MFTTSGIVGGFIMAIVVGGFFAIMIWSSNMKFMKKSFIQIAIFCMAFIFFAMVFSMQEKKWNNGYCIKCGTKYECVGKSRTSNEYYYSCPNCFYKTNYSK
jgi:hypothetical protein